MCFQFVGRNMKHLNFVTTPEPRCCVCNSLVNWFLRHMLSFKAIHVAQEGRLIKSQRFLQKKKSSAHIGPTLRTISLRSNLDIMSTKLKYTGVNTPSITASEQSPLSPGGKVVPGGVRQLSTRLGVRHKLLKYDFNNRVVGLTP